MATPDSTADNVAELADNPDAVRSALVAERAAARDARRELADVRRDLTAALDEVQRLQGEGATLTAERDAVTAERDALKLGAARYVVAAESGIPLEHAHRLNGSTPEELAADAPVLLDLLGSLNDPEEHADAHSSFLAKFRQDQARKVVDVLGLADA